MSEVRVREATIAEEETVWPLARDLATSFTPDREAFGRSFQRILSDPDAALLVAVTRRGGVGGEGEGEGADRQAEVGEAHRDEEVVGYVHVMAHPAFHANGNIAWVEEVMVSAQQRGAGTGRRLMAAAEQWAVSSGGAAYLALATRRAASFYRSLDYEESAVYFKKTF